MFLRIPTLSPWCCNHVMSNTKVFPCHAYVFTVCIWLSNMVVHVVTFSDQAHNLYILLSLYMDVGSFGC